ncbi:MAG: hypothetical protein ACRDIV_26795 [Ktedonobacteraceae bacterium]
MAARQVAANPVKAAAPPDPSVQGFLHVAYLRDRQVSAPAEKEQRTRHYLSATNTRADARRYLVEVRQKVEPQKGVQG